MIDRMRASHDDVRHWSIALYICCSMLAYAAGIQSDYTQRWLPHAATPPGTEGRMAHAAFGNATQTEGAVKVMRSSSDKG